MSDQIHRLSASGPSRRRRGWPLLLAVASLLPGYGEMLGPADASPALGTPGRHLVREAHLHLRPQVPRVPRYAIEFRARYALSYGHTFVMYGPIDDKGEFIERTVAGLHPAGDDPTPWVIGHVLPVQSETGPSNGDLDDRFVSARYRVVVSAQEYAHIVTYIQELQANSPRWHALFNNCSGFVADIGRFMGLRAPASVFIYPKDFIDQMREMNTGNDRAMAVSLTRLP